MAQALETTRVLCGFPAGGTTDAVSRRVADKLRPGYAKVALVENKPGAGGRLVARGLVERRRSLTDGRALHVLLTAQGQKLAQQVHAISLTMEDGMMQVLSPGERVMLRELLLKLRGVAAA